MCRCRTDPHSKLYSPLHVTVSTPIHGLSYQHSEPALQIPSSANHAIYLASTLSSPIPATITHLRVVTIPKHVLLPPALTHLKVTGDWHGDHLPATLIRTSFNMILSSTLHLPPRLTYLSIHGKAPLLPPLPASLTTLKLKYQLLDPLPDYPPNLTYLAVAYCSHEPPPLPNRLLTLRVLSDYGRFASSTQSLIHSKLLPPTITSLQLSASQFITDGFPPQLERFTGGFSIAIEKIPSTLTHLSFIPQFDLLLPNLPPNLTSLTLPRAFNHASLPLPSTLEVLSTPFQIPPGHSPPSLTRILFYSRAISSVPLSVTHLTFSDLYSFPIPPLHSGITHLVLGASFNHPLLQLPPTLTHLILGNIFNQPLPQLPNVLTHLTLGHYSYSPLPHLPASLLFLAGYNSYIPLPPLPSSLHTLILGNNFNQPLTDHLLPSPALPASLKYLVLGEKFYQTIHYLPPSLMWLCCGLQMEEKLREAKNSIPVTCHVHVRKSNVFPVFFDNQ